MVARGNVVLVTKVGNRRIETEELFYDPQSHKLWSTVKTLMIEGGSRVTGDGFNADDKFDNVTIKNAHGRVEGKMKF
jgi:lipopolysaccharide assembly outer membrane protein LptD (OstA)